MRLNEEFRSDPLRQSLRYEWEFGAGVSPEDASRRRVSHARFVHDRRMVQLRERPMLPNGRLGAGTPDPSPSEWEKAVRRHRDPSRAVNAAILWTKAAGKPYHYQHFPSLRAAEHYLESWYPAVDFDERGRMIAYDHARRGQRVVGRVVEV